MQKQKLDFDLWERMKSEPKPSQKNLNMRINELKKTLKKNDIY